MLFCRDERAWPRFLRACLQECSSSSHETRGAERQVEKLFEVKFRGRVIGRYSADLIVEKAVIVELKCCECLLREHQAQVINYLTVAQLTVGLLINFRYRKLEYKRLFCEEKVPFEEEKIFF